MIMEINGVSLEEIEGAIISYVVPPLTKILQEALYKIIKKEALVVGPGIKNGMNILMDHPAQIGRDLIAVAVGGIAEYKLPLAIFDLGTATTLCVVDEKKNYIGGMIMLGIKTSLNALAENASQLKEIDLEPPRRVIGKNTTECMRSGMIYSNAAAIDGIIDRVEEELGQTVTVVATGGLADFLKLCHKTSFQKVILSKNTLKGGFILKKRKIILSTVLAIVLLVGALGMAEAAEIAPLYAAVNDAKILLSISKDGTAEAYISVMPKNKDAIDYVSVNACIIKKSTASTVKTWKNFRVEQNPNK